MKIQLEINGIEDRRDLAAILADNGYKVRIIREDEVSFLSIRFIVEIEREDKKNEP